MDKAKVYVASPHVKASLVSAANEYIGAQELAGYKQREQEHALEEANTWEQEIRIVIEDSGVTTETYKEWLNDLGWKSEAAFKKETGIGIRQYVPEPKKESPEVLVEITATSLKLALRFALRQHLPQWVSGAIEEKVEEFYGMVIDHTKGV